MRERVNTKNGGKWKCTRHDIRCLNMGQIRGANATTACHADGAGRSQKFERRNDMITNCAQRKPLLFSSYWFGVASIAVLSAVLGLKFGVAFAWAGIPLVLAWPYALAWALKRFGVSFIGWLD